MKLSLVLGSLIAKLKIQILKRTKRKILALLKTNEPYDVTVMNFDA
jgi:hypothetical protein